MKKLYRPINLLLIVLTSMFMLNCTSDTKTDDDESATAFIHGKVSSGSTEYNAGSTNAADYRGSSITTPSGVTVEVMVQDDSGSESKVSGASVQTDENGNFTIEVQAGKSGNYIVIAKDSSGNEASAIVDGDVKENETVTVEPITENTTAQVEVLKNLKREGNFGKCFIHPVDLKDRMPSQLTAHLKGLSIEARKQLIGIIAQGICKSRMARVMTLQSLGISLDEIKALALKIIETRRILNIALINAGDDQDLKDQAFENFAKAVFEAHKDSPITPEINTKAETIATKIHATFDERFIESLLTGSRLHPELAANEMFGYRFSLLKRTTIKRSLAVHRYMGFNFNNLEIVSMNFASSDLYFKILVTGIEAITPTGASVEEKLAGAQAEIESLLEAYRNNMAQDLNAKSGTDYSAENDKVTVISDTLEINIENLIQDATNTPDKFSSEYLTYFTDSEADLAEINLYAARILIALGGNRF